MKYYCVITTLECINHSLPKTCSHCALVNSMKEKFSRSEVLLAGIAISLERGSATTFDLPGTCIITGQNSIVRNYLEIRLCKFLFFNK